MKIISEKQKLVELHGPNVGGILFAFRKVRLSVRHLLMDYLCQENICIKWNSPSLTQERRDEFFSVCTILKSKTVREVLRILDDYPPDKIMGTNQKREYLLKKFGLWTGK